MQPKAIAHPTDSRLYLKAIQILVRQAKRYGIMLRQSHMRLAKAAAVRAGRYAPARQFRRMRRELKRLRTFLGRVFRDVGRKIAGNAELEARFARLLGLIERLLAQKPKDRNEIYSLHAPEVVCISKGKARNPYEFGCRVGIAATNRDGLVLAAKAFEGNPYDGHTLAATVDQAVEIGSVNPNRIYVHKGYRGHVGIGDDRRPQARPDPHGSRSLVCLVPASTPTENGKIECFHPSSVRLRRGSSPDAYRLHGLGISTP